MWENGDFKFWDKCWPSQWIREKIIMWKICCGKLDKSRSCKKITDFKEVLLEHFEMDIENDKTVVHPTCVCKSIKSETIFKKEKQ